MPAILMMQAADARHLNNLPTVGRLHWPWDRTVVEESSVGTDFVVIVEITLYYQKTQPKHLED